MPDLVKIVNLSKSYGERRAVENISFALNPNEITALLGINGAGKTTTMRMLTGYIAPDEGSIFFGEKNLLENRETLLKHIGYLPESPALYREMTITDFLRYMYRIRLATQENENEAVELVLKKTDLGERRNEIIGNLSAGFRKRVGLAQAIIHKPEVLLLDEPIADLDPRQIREMKNLLRDLKADHAVLISSHILKEVYEIADRVLLMHEGKILADERRENIPAIEFENWFMRKTDKAA